MNPMRAANFIVGGLEVNGRRRWQAAGFAAVCAVLGLLAAIGLPVAAQEPDAEAQTNDVAAAEVLARISEMIQSAASGQPEDMAAPEDLAATNGLPEPASANQSGSRFGRSGRSDNTNQPQASGRSQSDDRRSRGRRPFRSRSDQNRSTNSAADSSRNGDRAEANASPGPNAGPAGLDYSAFRIIVDRNIFDPNRYPRRAGEPRVRTASRAVDSLTLVGTLSYERGVFAFFDGSSSEYKKALKLSDVIAGYKVSNIAPNSVKLAAGTNELELGVGMQLRREENGPWLLGGQSAFDVARPPSPSTNAVAAVPATGPDSASSATESDIIKKLMQRREQE